MLTKPAPTGSFWPLPETIPVLRFARLLLFIIVPLFLLIAPIAPALASSTTTSPLADRIASFPQWTSLPPTQKATGDLAYPNWFAGTWQATTRLIDLAAPLAPDLTTPGFEANRDSLNQPMTFRVRFVPRLPPRSATPKGFGASLKLQSEIVSDRAFNGLNIARAYLGDNAVTQVSVSPDNPNQQIIVLANDHQLLSRVNGRARETPTADRFLASEVCQQVFRGIAQPYLNRVETTTDYQHQPDGSILADQFTAIYLSPQDPDYFKAGDRPIALYHYRLDLQAVVP